MDDRIFLSVLSYILLVTLIGGVLPSSLWNGPESLDREGLVESFNTTGETVDEAKEQVSVLFKIVTFLFVPFVIAGVPNIVALIILFLNISSVIIGSIYVYDKVRGIS